MSMFCGESSVKFDAPEKLWRQQVIPNKIRLPKSHIYIPDRAGKRRAHDHVIWIVHRHKHVWVPEISEAA